MRKRGKQIEAVIAEREKLRAEYVVNTRERIKLQHQLDKATTALAKVVGLEALLDPQHWKGSV